MTPDTAPRRASWARPRNVPRHRATVAGKWLTAVIRVDDAWVDATQSEPVELVVWAIPSK